VIAFAVTATLVAACFAVQLLHAHLAARRARPMSADWCAECMRDLRLGVVFVVRSDHLEHADAGGGTYLAVTYCRKHAPKGAIRT
jgi:hypothetical protein